MAVGEWDQRELCPDGGCVGVIGPDGTCKVCGRAAVNWGNSRDPSRNSPASAADGDSDPQRIGNREAEPESEFDDDDDEYEDEDEDEDDEDDDEDDDLADLQPEAPALLGEAKEWNRRQLCSDGACVGVIGPDGRCKVCGKSASGKSPPKSPETDSSAHEAELLAAATDLAASFEEQRKLCPDGACVGVIGPDGTCTTCGKEAA